MITKEEAKNAIVNALNSQEYGILDRFAEMDDWDLDFNLYQKSRIIHYFYHRSNFEISLKNTQRLFKDINFSVQELFRNLASRIREEDRYDVIESNVDIMVRNGLDVTANNNFLLYCCFNSEYTKKLIPILEKHGACVNRMIKTERIGSDGTPIASSSLRNMGAIYEYQRQKGECTCCQK